MLRDTFFREQNRVESKADEGIERRRTVDQKATPSINSSGAEENGESSASAIVSSTAADYDAKSASWAHHVLAEICTIVGNTRKLRTLAPD